MDNTTIQTQARICPTCLDDHEDTRPCKQGDLAARIYDLKAQLAEREAELLGDLNRREVAHGKELTAAQELAEEHREKTKRNNKTFMRLVDERKDAEQDIDRLKSQHAKELEAQAEEHKRAMEKEGDLCSRIMEIEKRQHAKDLTKARVEGYKAGESAMATDICALREEEPALIRFEHPRLIGEPCMIHRDFEPNMKRLCEIAYACDVKLWVTHSVRYLDQEMLDLVVKKAKRSNHLAGSALDMNPVHDGVWYTNEKMKTWSSLPIPVQNFLSRVDDVPDLRWGGAFGVNKDNVHIDSDLVRRDPDEWARRVKELNDG